MKPFSFRHRLRLLAFTAFLGLIVLAPLALYVTRNAPGAQAGWWANGGAWAKRKQLTLDNTTAESLAAQTTVAVTLNTKELYDTGKLQADCDDLRVLYQPNTTTTTEVTRHLVYPAGTTCATSQTTKVYFPLQATLANATQTTDYFMYFSNPDATTPATTVDAFDTSSAQALLVCPFNGTTQCINGDGPESPTTETGAIRYSGSKSALSFDGKSDIIQMTGSDASVDGLPNQAFTTEFWIKINSWTAAGTSYIINKANTSNEGWRFFGSDAHGIEARIDCATANAYARSGNDEFTADGLWHHIAFTFDYNGDKKIHIWIDGVEVSSYSLQAECQGSYQGDNTDPIYIGANNSMFTFNVDGQLDEIRISNINRYTGNFTPQTTPFVRDDNTVLLYHFDENGDDPRNTGKALDDSGNDNHGTITGAKYVSGLVGVNNGTTDSGYTPQQSYAGHEGIFIEEGTTNKITNPSFEHATYNTNWTASGGTATENTDPTYVKFGSKSYRLVLSDSTDRTITTSVNAGNTNTHVLSAYVYRGTSGNVGGTVSSSVAQLVFNGSAQTTTYTDVGGGWWRLTYAAAAGSGAQSYGVQVNENSGTLYIDGVQLEENPYQYVTSYADGSLGTGYSWTGTPNESTSTRAASEVAGYDREGNFSCEQGTISFWMKKQTVYPAVSEYYPRILALRRIGEDTIGFHQGYRGGNLTFQLTGYNPSYYSYSTDYNISGWALNSWHHVVGTYEDNGTAVLYVDGVQRNSVNLGDLAADCGSTFEFRTTLQSSNRPGNQIIADLRSYNAPLSSNEVVDLYYSGLVSHSQSYEVNRFSGDKGQDPLAIWHFDESYGSTAHDSSTYKHNLAISGASWNTQSVGAHNRLVRNLQFDGTDDVATLQAGAAGNFNFGTGSFTLSGWFRHASTISGPDTIISRYNTAGYKVYMNSSGQICFGIDDDSTWGPDDVACSTQSYANSKWHHFEAVRDTGTIILYIDGLQVANAAVTATGSLSNSASLTVGADSNSTNFWTGNLDEIIVYPYARSEEQVKTDFAGGQTAAYFGASQNDFMTDGLVGYWKMDESTDQSRIDSSGNGNTLTQSAGDVIDAAAGKFGSGADFENSSSEAETLYIDDSSHNGLDITGQITIATWVRRESINWGINNLVSKHHSDSGQRSYMLTLNGTQLEFWLSPDGNSPTQVSIAEAVPLNDTWYHIVGAYDGTRMMLYINGSLASDPVSYNGGIFNSTANFRIGGSDSGWYFDGVIDETRIYNRALSPDEVRALYDWAPGPVGHWKMEELSGSRYDSSGYGNVLTDENTVGSAIGKYGKAANFMAQENEETLTIADNAQNGLDIAGPLTISAWVKPTSVPNPVATIVSKSIAEDDTQNSYLLYLNSAYGATFAVSSNGNSWTVVQSDPSIATGNWSYVSAVYDGASIKIYINGKLASTPTSFSSSIFNGTAGFFIGAQEWTFDRRINPFDGAVDDVQVYNYARTPAQIIEDMNAGHPAPGSPVGSSVAQWRFDDLHGTIAQDSSQNDNDLTLSTASWTTNGKFAGAWNGLGTNWLTRADDPDLDFGAGEEFTVSLWVKSDSADNPASSQTLLNKRVPTNNPGYNLSFNTSGQIVCGIDDDAFVFPEDSAVTNTDFYDGTWHNVVCIRNVAANTLDLYVDGVLSGQDTNMSATGDLSNADNFTLGDSNEADDGDEFNGDIDEVRIFRSTLTPEQVKQLVNQSKAQVFGSTSTDATGNNTSSASREYCVPGDTTPCSPPAVHWTLDEKTGTYANDKSGNENRGTLGGDGAGTDFPSWKPSTSCKSGACLDFDGIDDYINAGSNTSVDDIFDGGGSVDLWIKPRTAGEFGTGVIISKGDDSGWNLQLQPGSGNTADLVLRVNFDDAYTLWRVENVIDLNQWNHVAISYNDDAANNDPLMYVNGVLQTLDLDVNAAGNYVSDNAQEIAIGGAVTGNPNFDGLIDEIKLYDYVRTPAQIAWDYNRGAPVGWWRFDECSGDTAHDATDNGNNGTISAGDSSGSNDSVGTCSGSAGEMWADGAIGKSSASLEFDGTNDYVNIGDEVIYDFEANQDFSLSIWVKTNIDPVNDTYPSIISKAGGTTRYGYQIIANLAQYDSIWHGEIYHDDTTYRVAGKSDITDNQWHHLVFIRSDSTIYTYEDGRLSNSEPATTDTIANVGNLTIGTYSSLIGNGYDGQIDDVRIYNYALTPTQIKTLYNDGSAVSF